MFYENITDRAGVVTELSRTMAGTHSCIEKYCIFCVVKPLLKFFKGSKSIENLADLMLYFIGMTRIHKEENIFPIEVTNGISKENFFSSIEGLPVEEKSLDATWLAIANHTRKDIDQEGVNVLVWLLEVLEKIFEKQYGMKRQRSFKSNKPNEPKKIVIIKLGFSNN